jgi:hypothetical protein
VGSGFLFGQALMSVTVVCGVLMWSSFEIPATALWSCVEARLTSIGASGEKSDRRMSLQR